MKCPQCENKINWFQKWRFNKGFCSRQDAECPHCGIKLIWSKWHHRLMNLGSAFILLGSCSNLYFPVRISGGFDLHFLCTILAIALIIPGIFLLKLKVVSKTKE